MDLATIVVFVVFVVLVRTCPGIGLHGDRCHGWLATLRQRPTEGVGRLILGVAHHVGGIVTTGETDCPPHGTDQARSSRPNGHSGEYEESDGGHHHQDHGRAESAQRRTEGIRQECTHPTTG